MSAEHVFQMGSRRKSVKNDMAVWSVESPFLMMLLI